MSKRLNKEFADLCNTPLPWCKCQLQGDNLYKWKAVIQGPEGSPYENGSFQLEIEIPIEYPFKPPKMKFVTKIYHPNVKSDGSICSDVLTEGWSPQLKISEVLLTLRNLMTEPNPENPLEPDIALAYKNDKNGFNKTAKEWTKKYAK